MSAVGPVFLVGCPRSGTTLLQRLLDAHPDLAIAPETHYVRRIWKRRRELPGGGDVLDDADRRTAQDWFVAMPEFREMQLDERVFRERTQDCADLPGIFLALLRLYAEPRESRIVGEKTPNHLRSMRLLEQQFPQARFVHIVRDPRAVVDSWSRVPWTNGSPELDAEVWRKYMQAAREAPPRDPSRLHTLRYEDLLDDAASALKRVCAFLGVDYHPAMMDFHRQQDPSLNLEREPWKVNAADPLRKGAADGWRACMSDEAVRAAEAVVWFEARRLGYTLDGRGVTAWIAAGKAAWARARRSRAGQGRVTSS